MQHPDQLANGRSGPSLSKLPLAEHPHGALFHGQKRANELGAEGAANAKSFSRVLASVDMPFGLLTDLKAAKNWANPEA